MKELICITCPRGCHLKVDEDNNFAVSGAACEKGVAYGENELRHPVRVFTSTVVIEGALHRRLPVKTNGAIPKDLMLAAAREIMCVKVSAPVKCGEVIIKDFLGTGIDLVSAKKA